MGAHHSSSPAQGTPLVPAGSWLGAAGVGLGLIWSGAAGVGLPGRRPSVEAANNGDPAHSRLTAAVLPPTECPARSVCGD